MQDTIDTLKLNNPILYLGRVRRDNINFDIHPLEKTVEGSRDEFKVDHVAKQIEKFVAEGAKRWSTAHLPLQWRKSTMPCPRW